MCIFFNQNGYYQGIFFLIVMMLASCVSDVIAKFMGQHLNAVEVIFFRFFFGLITLLPFILSKGIRVLKTSSLFFNITRGLLGVISFYLYTYSLVHIQLVEVVTILWISPLFVIILSALCLNESVGKMRCIATVFGFLGIAIIVLQDSGTIFSFKWIYMIPVFAAFLFSVQDVIIKKMLNNENHLSMLFYYSLVTTILTFVPMIFVWQTPTIFELTMLFCLGVLANILQYFLFRAFSSTNLSALAPFKYLEFALSTAMGFVFFSEIPSLNVLTGAVILVISTLYLAYSENKKRVNVW
jgi:S-adenosylmethionine uptake transporter